MQITVATWNIAGGRPMRSGEVFDYEKEDINYFTAQLKSLDSDIICLQENHSNDERSVAKKISEQLGNYSCFEQVLSPSHVDREYNLGNTVLSKQKPSHEENILFPYPSFPLYLPGNKPAVRHDKGFQVVQFDNTRVINLQMLPLRFLGTAYDTPQGEGFALEMEMAIKPHVASPSLLCGDFNVENANELYRNIIQKFSMKDALPGVATRPNNKQSDYIFYSTELRCEDAGVIKTNTDHYLCWARFSI